jgi:hypothetical protein
VKNPLENPTILGARGLNPAEFSLVCPPRVREMAGFSGQRRVGPPPNDAQSRVRLRLE